MPFVARPVDFDSINYLPGFPSISKYDCAPDSWNPLTGGCNNPPVSVGRERRGVIDAQALIAALQQAGAKAPSILGGLGSAGSYGYHRRVGTGIHGIGAAAGSGSLHRRRGMGCGCGGSCGGGGGCGCGDKSPMSLGQLDLTSMAGIVTWLESNWMPLAIGAGVAWMLKRK
jgi:hypothetical protein